MKLLKPMWLKRRLLCLTRLSKATDLQNRRASQIAGPVCVWLFRGNRLASGAQRLRLGQCSNKNFNMAEVAIACFILVALVVEFLLNFQQLLQGFERPNQPRMALTTQGTRQVCFAAVVTQTSARGLKQQTGTAQRLNAGKGILPGNLTENLKL